MNSFVSKERIERKVSIIKNKKQKTRRKKKRLNP